MRDDSPKIISGTLGNYGSNAESSPLLDTLGTRCAHCVLQMLNHVDFDNHWVRAILPFGLTEFDVHDVFNIFQRTGPNAGDEYFMKTCPAQPGDYFGLFAEEDLVAALSACTGRHLSKPLFGGSNTTFFLGTESNLSEEMAYLASEERLQVRELDTRHWSELATWIEQGAPRRDRRAVFRLDHSASAVACLIGPSRQI